MESNLLSIQERMKPLSSPHSEIVWSVGDRCEVKWPDDNMFYPAVIKRLKHRDRGVVALVKFDDWDSEDSEVMDVKLLRKVKEPKDSKQSDGLEKRDSGEQQGGFFKPLTGSEDFTRLEDKYGHESDSEHSDSPTGPEWISSTPYRTMGKVSQWTVRSPAKSPGRSPAKSPAKRSGKAAVVKSGSPRKKLPNANLSNPQARQDLEQQGRSSRGECAPTGEAGSCSESHTSSHRRACKVLSYETAASRQLKHTSCPQGANPAIDDEDFAVLPAAEHSMFEGFDEDDLEKPKFSFPAQCDKVAFTLDENEIIQIPAPLNQYLRDYQRQGIQFLYSHFTQNRGAVLGDDMGLGKTVQVIGFLSAVMRKQGNKMDVMRQKPRFIRQMSDTPYTEEENKCRPFLIIGPGSVLYNWLDELETWGYFTARKYHGVTKAACLTDVLRGKVEVVVTTFETCRDNLPALNEVKWEAVIVDEVHRIKGLKARTTQALRMLKCARRYGLTGTALQNNLSELWCILDWAQPGVLGSAEAFEDEFVQPIALGQKQNATKRELAEARKKKEKFARVRTQMLLRRTKKLIADQLPLKSDRVVFCRLSPLQEGVYRAVLSHPDLQHVIHKDDPCPCSKGLPRAKCCFKKLPSGKPSKSVIFSFMHMFLKISNHVALLIPHTAMSSEQLQQGKEMCDVAFKDHPEFLTLTRDAAFRTLSDPSYCGKMKVLQGMLSVFARSHSKVLVFSYSTRLLDILEQYIISEGHEYRRIDGSVPAHRRQAIVREFNADPNIFLCLVSTKAGGLGLNMTGANKVVIFDPNWNPSHDLQAQDRAYRIGQRRDVEVYRLISAGSIEENIYLRQIYKQQLDNIAIGTENARRYFQGIQGDADNKGELFGVKNMFTMRTGDSCLTMDILSRNAKMEAKIAGQQMAEYIPSRHETLASDNDTSHGSDSGREDNTGESSDEDSIKVLHQLFGTEPGYDEEQGKSPAKHPASRNSEPQPSTSGLGRQMADRQRPDRSDTAGQRTKPSPQGNRSGQRQGVTGTASLNFTADSEDSDENTLLRPRQQGARLDRGSRAGTRRHQSKSAMQDSLVTPTFSAITSVFDECGVVHVHENRSVVGASRVEDHITRCAIQDVFERCTDTQAPALLCDPMSQPSESNSGEKGRAPGGRRGRRKASKDAAVTRDHNSAKTVDHSRWHILFGQTPKAIKKKQWEALKACRKSSDDVTLAAEVMSASAQGRLSMLMEMYHARLDSALRPALDDLLTLPPAPPPLSAHQTQAGSREGGVKRTGTKGQSTRGKKRVCQPRTSQGRRLTKVRQRAATGLLYTAVDDSQATQPSKCNHPDNNLSSDDSDSSLDLGAKVSPAKNRRTLRRRKGKVWPRRTQSIIPPTQLDRTKESVGPEVEKTWKVRQDGSQTTEQVSSTPAEDVDRLLTELGRKNTSCESDQPRCGSKRKISSTVSKHLVDADKVKCSKNYDSRVKKCSVLDDIFSDPGDQEEIKRKPPPSRGQTAGDTRGERTAKKQGISSHAPRVGRAAPKSPRAGSSDLFSDFMNNSTLADDDVDCFGEPSQWKKRRRGGRAHSSKTDQLFQEDADSYLGLFGAGSSGKKKEKVKSARQGQKEESIQQRVSRKVSSELDPSGSLF